MEFHKICLDNMCRICTNRAQKKKDIVGKKNPRYASNYSDMIYVLFGIDIADDDRSIHPTKICDECYQHLMNSDKTGTHGQHCHEMNLNGVYGTLKDKVKDTCYIWKKHTDSICAVCELYRNQSKPGISKKTKRGGSTKLSFDSSSCDIFDSLFSEDTGINKLSDCDVMQPDIHKSHFIFI